MATDYSLAVGSRLRTVRQQQGLSLQGVEERSHARWKAVVVGSYERGDRAVSIQRLAELAQFYGVPVSQLLPDPQLEGRSTAGRVVIDLERLALAPAHEAAPLARFVQHIQSRRGDYNGRVLTVRADDMTTLALLYGDPVEVVRMRLVELGVLAGEPQESVPEPRRP